MQGMREDGWRPGATVAVHGARGRGTLRVSDVDERRCARDHEARPTVLDPDPGPALAEKGVLCTLCYSRLLWQVRTFPELLEFVRAAAYPQAAAGTGAERVSGTKDSRRLPMNEHAMTTADELFATFANEARVLAQTLELEPKQVPRVLLTAFVNSRSVDALSSNATLGDVRRGAEAIGGFVAAMLPAAVERYEVVDVYDALVDAVGDALAAYPLSEPRARRQRSRPCPACEERSVLVSWTGDDPLVTCTRCGFRVGVSQEVLDDLARLP